MKTIWKWTLKPKTEITMPKYSTILCVQMQDGEPQLWALVNPKNLAVTRTFICYGTGHTLPDNPGEYVSTCQMSKGLVFHVFEEGV
jgi:hypothetical protein